MVSKIRNKVIFFINSSDAKNLPIIAAIASGIYPLLYYYNSNFGFVNSWSQLFFFIISFILLPCVLIYSVHLVFKHTSYLNPYSKYVIPVLNYTIFVFLVIVSTYGLEKKILVLSLITAFIFGIFFYKAVNKIIVFQLILAVLVSARLIPDIYTSLTYSNQWMEQPDAIEEVVFKKRPNVYIIQPDGYANFSELKRGYYNFDNKLFETFLSQKKFKLYDNFRSNYYSTLSSNSSLFAMKHHYYNNTQSLKKELFNARKIIVEENPVVSIFKNNDYKTFLLLETPYLLINRPNIFYDFSNITLKEISYISRGFSFNKDLIDDLKIAIEANKNTNNFYFIEKLSPSHIPVSNSTTTGKINEREKYINNIKEANIWLKDIVNMILEKDKNSLIVIVADHGGFVGFNYTTECKIKETDVNLINSIFTSALAIKWPNEYEQPEFDDKLKTSVNLFRILFSYLSENDTYLNNLQDDKSYITIESGATPGTYEYIDENDNIVFVKKSFN